MSRRIFTLDRRGVRELLKSPEVEETVRDYADEAVGRLGSGYAVDVKKGRNRGNAAVYPESGRAKHENYVQNTILKAVFGK